MEYNCSTCKRYHEVEDGCHKTCYEYSGWMPEEPQKETRNDCNGCAQKVITEDGMIGCKCPQPHHCNDCTTEEQERFYKGENVKIKVKRSCETCKHRQHDIDDYPCSDCLNYNRIKWEAKDRNATAKLDGENVNEYQTMSKQLQDIPLVDKTNTQDWIVLVCDEIKELLLSKNRKYGDSALNPCRVFAKSDAREQLNVRIDDKLNRIRNRQNDEDEDVELDLIGYLILKRIAKLTNKEVK